MRRAWVLIGLALVLLVAVSCAPGPNPAAKTANEDGKVAGLWVPRRDHAAGRLPGVPACPASRARRIGSR